MSYRILSLDGGGIKGTFTAAFLAVIEKQIGAPIGNYFDLIVGTSTGGIIALGLGAQLSVTDILAFYEEDGPKIFGKQSLFNSILSYFRPKFGHADLDKCLQNRFKGKRLGESTTRLVVPSFDLERGKIHLFKTAHLPKYETDYQIAMSTIAAATAAAPTYFPTFKTPNGASLIDGGLWANNPILVGVIEAIANLDWPRDQIKVLSIGTTQSPLNIREDQRWWRGKFFWAKRSPDVFLTGQSDGAIAMTERLIGATNVRRINPVVPSKRYDLDKVDELQSLRALGENMARDALPEMRRDFFHSPRASFTPAHLLGP